MLGKVVQESQRDWDDRLPYVMASYRASRHESTGLSPNMLVFRRENLAPADLVLEPVRGEEAHYDSMDDFVYDLQVKIRDAHHLAREHLRTAAERRKEVYDIKVKDTKFKEGQWVWYLLPRKFVGRYPKWTRNYQGPYLVIKVLPPCDYQIQRSKQSVPIVVHGDKMKLCYGETPSSWLVPKSQPNAASTESPTITSGPEVEVQSVQDLLAISPSLSGKRASEVRRPKQHSSKQLDPVCEEYERNRQLPPRTRRLPARFADFSL